MIIMLFGLAGSGKNFVGDIVQDKFGFHYWDADEALTDVMKDYIKMKKNFTPKMIDEYCKIIIARINALKIDHPNLIVSQALYRERNRLQIQNAVSGILFCQVEASDELVAERLVKRNNGVDKDYVASFRKFFQKPKFYHWKIENISDDVAVEKQFQSILNDMSVWPGVVPELPKLSTTNFFQAAPSQPSVECDFKSVGLVSK